MTSSTIREPFAIGAAVRDDLPKMADIRPVASPEDEPYALASAEERQRRISLMALPHIRTLADYLSQLRISLGPGFDTPSFDPCDGGAGAKALFLLEAPGPKAVSSAFVSRNNPDPTAKNLCGLLADAHLPRSATLIWNAVPYYVGEAGKIRAVNSKDLQLSRPFLKELLGLLPELMVVVLMGKKAQKMAQVIKGYADVLIIYTPHPSARVFNTWPEKKTETADAFRAVAKLITENVG